MQASFVRQARFVHGGATADCCRPSCRAAARHQHSLCAVSSTPEAATERFVVSEADCGADYDKVGALRAAAFYEDRPDSRFVQHKRTQFARQEARLVPQRDTVTCLVARHGDDGAVVATLDIHAPETVSGGPTTGVPLGVDTAAYIMNLTVDEETRGQGLAKLLIQAAAGYAKDSWQASCVYVQVAPSNQVAWGLYSACGFEAASEADVEAAGTSNKLLRLDLETFSSSVPVQGLEECPV